MCKLFVNSSGRCGRMRASARLATIVTNNSQTVHIEFTSSSQHVQEQFTDSSRAVHDYCATVALTSVRGYICGFLDTARLYRDRQQRDKLYHMTLKTKKTKWHDLPQQNRGRKSCKCQPCITYPVVTVFLHVGHHFGYCLRFGTL